MTLEGSVNLKEVYLRGPSASISTASPILTTLISSTELFATPVISSDDTDSASGLVLLAVHPTVSRKAMAKTQKKQATLFFILTILMTTSVCLTLYKQ